MPPRASHQWKTDPVFGNSVQTVSCVGTEMLHTVLVPLFISITTFTIIIIVIDGTFTPSVIIERKKVSGCEYIALSKYICS